MCIRDRLAAWPMSGRAQGAPADAPARLAPVVVTATRTAESPFELPASIDRIGVDTIRDARPQVNISESLGGVAGLLARDRQNYAQDVQISVRGFGARSTFGIRGVRLYVDGIPASLGGVAGLLARDRQNYAQDVQISVRGFGARSTFGIRGVRLYVDGIPATLPDGQGQISNVDLGSADSIEVLRGPFSALYGNSSGGVIQVFSEEGSGPPTVGAARGVPV